MEILEGIKLINLTDHKIDIISHESYVKKGTTPKVLLTIQPSGTVARVNPQFNVIKKIKYCGVFLDVANLDCADVQGVPPVENPGIYYIVSKMVAGALQGKRNDLLVMHGLYRYKGVTLGCRSFTQL